MVVKRYHSHIQFPHIVRLSDRRMVTFWRTVTICYCALGPINTLTYLLSCLLMSFLLINIYTIRCCVFNVQ